MCQVERVHGKTVRCFPLLRLDQNGILVDVVSYRRFLSGLSYFYNVPAPYRIRDRTTGCKKKIFVPFPRVQPVPAVKKLLPRLFPFVIVRHGASVVRSESRKRSITFYARIVPHVAVVVVTDSDD